MEFTIKPADVQTWTPLISALTALVAVVVGPFVTMWVAKRQIRASTVSVARRDWNDQLRAALAGLWATCYSLGPASKGLPFSVEKAASQVSEYSLWAAKIDLLLDPEDDIHLPLFEKTKSVLPAINHLLELLATDATGEEQITAEQVVADRIAEVVGAARPVLGAEWKKIKAGE